MGSAGRACQRAPCKGVIFIRSMKCNQIPEFRTLLSSARDFVDGNQKASIHALNGNAVNFTNACKAFGQHTSLIEIAKEWEIQINRYWNEWGTEKNPISKEEFIAWLKEQLVLVKLKKYNKLKNENAAGGSDASSTRPF